MKTIQIRQAFPEDANSIYNLVHAAMTIYMRDSGIPILLDSLKESPVDVHRYITENHVLVASHSNEMAGTVRISALDAQTAEISRFAVLPGTQRTGIGSKLYNEAEKYILEQGFRKIVLHTALTNHRAVQFYTSKGFTLSSRTSDRGYPRGLFVKVLKPDVL